MSNHVPFGAMREIAWLFGLGLPDARRLLERRRHDPAGYDAVVRCLAPKRSFQLVRAGRAFHRPNLRRERTGDCLSACRCQPAPFNRPLT
jgi:hypothetical protein